MHVLVNVRFGPTVSGVCMLMVLVVNVTVGVYQMCVLVIVGMRFRQYQPGCDCHECGGDNQRQGDRLAEQGYGKCCSDEWRGAEVCSGTRGAEMPQSIDEEHKADAVGKKSKCQRAGHCCQCGKLSAQGEPKSEIEAAGDKTFRRSEDVG